jgi:polyhydroxyalkanoate synthesis regulator phasin
MSDDQKLTDEQQKAIQDILRRYREEAEAIIADHRDRVKIILNDLDKKKAEELQKMIQS